MGEMIPDQSPPSQGGGFPTWLYSRILSNSGLEEEPDFGWDRESGMRQLSLRAQFHLPVSSLSWLGLPNKPSVTKPPETPLGSQIPQ